MDMEPKHEARNIILSVLIIMVCPWLIVYTWLYWAEAIDIFCMAHQVGVGVSCIVVSFVGSIFMARYFTDQYWL